MRYSYKDLVIEYRCTYHEHKIYRIVSGNTKYLDLNSYLGCDINVVWDLELNEFDRFVVDPFMDVFVPLNNLMETE